MNRFRYIVGAMASACLLWGAVPPLAAAGTDTYSEHVRPAYEDTFPVTKPAWSSTIDHDTGNREPSFIAAGSGAVYYLKNQTLVAANAANGQVKWTFGRGLEEPILLQGTVIYAASRQGTIYAVDTKTGETVWSAVNGKGIRELKADGDILYVGIEKGLAAYDAGSGKLIWEMIDSDANEAYGLYVAEDAVLQQYSVSGAITHTVTVAFNKATGELLWNRSYNSTPIGEKGHYLYSVHRNFMVDDPNMVTVELLDSKSGEVVQSHTYKVDTAPGDPYAESAPKIGKVVIDGDQLMFSAGSNVYRYHRDADPERTKPVIQRLGACNLTSNWVAGPYAGRYFYTNGTGLESYYPSKQLYTSYGVDNPLSRMELHANGVYAGQTDGQFRIFDLQMGKTLLKAKTEARLFADFIIEGNMVLVQAERLLLAYNIPEAARKDIATLVNRQHVVKAEAALNIDGKEIHLHPEPVMFNNRMFVPFRSLFSAVGATVDYEAATKTVRAIYRENQISFRANESLVNANGAQIGLSEASFLYNNTIYIPLRDASTVLGAKVDWNMYKRTVTIDTAQTGP